ncbi:hypothetical protein ACMYYO_13120 [Dermacoccaceae bacterium W4C1]
MSRPGVGTEAAEHVSSGNLNGGSSIAPTTDAPQRSVDFTELSTRRDFYVRVYSQRRDGIVAVQVFADLRSAERKVDRVRSKGLAARLELIRVISVMPLESDEAVTG